MIHIHHPHAHTFHTHPHTVADLIETSVTCSRMLGSSSPDAMCPFQMTQDRILEGDEFIVFVLTVAESASNDITPTRNCSIGRILAASNPGM